MQTEKIKNQKAFTILEVIVALGIVSISIVYMLTLNLQAMKVSASNNRQTIASMLSQEGLELVRNKRDSNWKDDAVDWDDGIGAGTYIVDYNGLISSSCNNISCADLYVNNTTGFYDYDSNNGALTPYKRLITITSPDDDSLEVKSEVQWQESGGVESYSASMRLYNWYE